MVDNPQPAFVVPMASADGTSLALPSRFAFYGFQDLYVVPFKNAHLAKLQRAANEGSLQPIVEAVSSVIYTSTEGYTNLAPMLTMPDFFAVMLWLRHNSFTKTSFIHNTMCKNIEHLEQVKAGTKDRDSLKITHVVNRTNVQVKDLEQLPDPEVFTLGEDHPLMPLPPTMADVLEFLDAPEMKDPNTRSEFAYLCSQASHTQGRDRWYSLRERLDMMEDLTPDQAHMLKEYEAIMKGYGVQESIQVTCKGCGASQVSKLIIDAHSFLASGKS